MSVSVTIRDLLAVLWNAAKDPAADTNNRANIRNRETRVGLAISPIQGENMLEKEIESRKSFAGLGLNDVLRLAWFWATTRFNW